MPLTAQYREAGMRRRLAILDDNDEWLGQRLATLRTLLPPLIADRACAAMVIGSVAEGRARDASDIDVVVVLRAGEPRRADYRWWDAQVTPGLDEPANRRFPVQPVIIARASLATDEPHLRAALRSGIPLWDPEHLFDDKPEAAA
jgi:predicted nucleotidyltransferase